MKVFELKELLKGYNKEVSVKIKDPERTEKIIQNLIKDGHEKLQFIADFDWTISRFQNNGELVPTCQGVLIGSQKFPEEFREYSSKLYKKYLPIELDNSISRDEKSKHMWQWYNKWQENLSTFKIERSLVKTIVGESNPKEFLRDNTKELLSQLNEKQVPVLIFSGGLGDVLEEILAINEALFPNIKGISNYMEFDENEKLVRFKEPIVHPSNKSEIAIENSVHFNKSSGRKNAILIGDSLGDSEMGDGIANSGTVLKIGFLNNKVEEKLDKFMATFDIVLIEDDSMNFVLKILNDIL